MDDLAPFFEELSSGAPIPGGGSVAALQIAMSGALLSMVCNLTIGRKRYAAAQAEVTDILRDTESLRMRAQQLATEDARAYGHVAAAMALPKTSDVERAARASAIQHALKSAIDPPLAAMQLATKSTGLAERLVSICNPNAISDVGVAVLAARAGYRAAQLNVEINLAAIRDLIWSRGIRDTLSGLSDPEKMERRVLTQVESIISGDAA